LARLLSSPDVRKKLGIDLSNGEVIALHSTDAVAKSLTYVVEQLKTGAITVPDVYTAEDRSRYAANLPTQVSPKKKTALDTPVSLAGLTEGQTKPAAAKPKKKAKPKPPQRTAVIPKSAILNVTPPRINAIYYELLSLAAEQYPNACAVLLRVFLELSVDHFVEEYKLPVLTSDPLAKRLKAVAKKLTDDGMISTQLKKAIDQIADGPTPVAPGVSTFHQYVHNRYSFPKVPELFSAWDELQPLMEKLWPS
jgi:hypothetical protein